MVTAAQKLQDAAIDHIINLTHYSNGLVRQVQALMRSVESDLVAKLTTALLELDAGSFTVQRLNELLAGVRQLDARMQAALRREAQAELRALVDVEATFQRGMLGPAAQIPSMEQMYASTTAKPFHGSLLSEWFDGLAASRQKRLISTVARGFAEGQTISEIVRAVRGTKAQSFMDGILQIGRRDAEAVVRTAVAHTAAVVRETFYEQNADLIESEEWVSTLDTRTTPICQIRDGLQYTAGEHNPIGHKVPWGDGPGRIHWGCRSTSVPVLRDLLGLRLRPVERAAQGGPAAPGTTYSSWLQRQSAARQDEVLGPTRGKLMRKGKMKFERFFNNQGTFLTLQQLRERNASAFEKAGV